MKSLLSIVILASSAAAHTIFQELYVDGVSAGHLSGIRHPNSNGPLTDVLSNDLICNGGPNPLITPYPTEVIQVPAGAKLTAEWHHQLDTTPGTDADDPIAASHLGPVIVYMAKVSSALTKTVTGLKWFKVYEDGLDSKGQWAVTRLYNNKGKVSFTVPKCIQNGDYLLRAEIIALHQASSYPGAQFYMECAQIRVTGGGSNQASGVAFPGAYHTNDPGIQFNLYWPTPTSYKIPGPTVFKC